MAFARKRTALGSKLAGPKPVVLPSEKKENAGQDPNVSLVPHKRGVWGSLSTGPKPDDQLAGNDADVSHEGGQAGALATHAPSAGGPAWGGAGLPERIQEQAEVAKDSASDDMTHGGSGTPVAHGEPRHGHGHLRQWDDYGGRHMHDPHAPPPPPPPPQSGPCRSDSEHHPYPPRAPPPPGPPPPGPPPHYVPRGGHHGPPDYHPSDQPSGMPQHVSHHPRSHPRRDMPDLVKRHPGFSPEGNFTAKLEAMSARGGSQGPPLDMHPPRRGPAEPRSSVVPVRPGQPNARGNSAGQHVTSQTCVRDDNTPVEVEPAEQSQKQPEQARSASASSQDAAAALASAAAAAAAVALQRPPPAASATVVPLVNVSHPPAQPRDLSGQPLAQAGPARPVQMGTPVMHLVQGQPIPHGMQPLPPGVAVLPMMPGVQQKATSHVMVPNIHPATMPVTMHMGPGGMMPVISSHGPPVAGTLYQHLPTAHPHLPHQMPAQAVMHPQAMLVQHPGGATLPSAVRPQHAVMGPVLPPGPHASVPSQPDAQVAATGPPSVDKPLNEATAMDHDARTATAGLSAVPVAAPPAVASQGASEAPPTRLPQGQGAVDAGASIPGKPVMVSQWSRPPITDAAPGRGRRDEPRQRGPVSAPAEAAMQQHEQPSKRRASRGDEQGRGQAPGRGASGSAKPGRKPDADVSGGTHSQQRPERSGRGRGRREGAAGAGMSPEPVGQRRGAGPPLELPAEGVNHDAGRGRGRGRGWGRGAGRGMGREGRGEAIVGDRPHEVTAERGHASDGSRVLADAAPGRGPKQAGRGRGRRSSNGRENGRGPEAVERNGLSRGDRSSVSEGAVAAPADTRSHDTNISAASRAAVPGRGRRNPEPPRSQGRGGGKNNEVGQPRHKDGGDSAVNIVSAAARATAAAASVSAEIAPQVFTQALAKIEAVKIPELPQSSTKPSDSRIKDLHRVSKGRKSRGRHATSVDGHTTGPKQ